MSTRLTKKKLEDARFRKNEEAILKAFFDCGRDRLSVTELARKADVDKATFYRHHKKIYGIVTDYEEYILIEYESFMCEMLNKNNVSIRVIYYRLLIFILKNQEAFAIFLENQRMAIIMKMVGGLVPKLKEEYKLYGNLERVFRVYVGEIVGLIEEWIERGFRDDEMMELLDNIMYLTKTIRLRLLPLIN